MRAKSPFCTFVAVLSIASLGSGQAMAAAPAAAGDTQAPDQAAVYEQEAIAAFEAGRYEDAVSNFKQAYELDQNPNILFNIGRVYEEAGDLEAAVDFYKQFISKPGVSLDNRKFALERIDVLEQIVAKTKPVEDEPEQPVEPPPPAVEDPAPAQPEIDAGVDADNERRRKQRIGGYVLLGVGAASLIGGGVVGGLASSTQTELADTSDPARRVELVEQGDSRALTADVLFITGGTLALVGLIVTLTALPKRGDKGRTALAPSFGRDGGGVVLRHRF